MKYAKWQQPTGGDTKYHAIALSAGQEISFDQSTGKFSSTTNPLSLLMTKCGREVPADHVGVAQLPLEEFNNNFCNICHRAHGL